MPDFRTALFNEVNALGASGALAGTEPIYVATAPSGARATSDQFVDRVENTSPLSPSAGFQINVQDTLGGSNIGMTWGGNSSSRVMATFDALANCANLDPGFTNNVGVAIGLRSTNGRYFYWPGGSPQTLSKTSYIPLQVGGIYNSSGQKFAGNFQVVSYGMGDTSVWANNWCRFAGGPVSGDEGQGFGLFSNLEQMGPHRDTVREVTRPTYTSALAQNISMSKDPQTVNVVSSTGANVGDWIQTNHAGPFFTGQTEAVKLLAVGPGNTITAVFVQNHLSGESLTPCTLIRVDNAGLMGQDRALVNLTGAVYSTGLAAGSTASKELTGSGGASWSNGMVGGTFPNIGAITLEADDVNFDPYSEVSYIDVVFTPGDDLCTPIFSVPAVIELSKVRFTTDGTLPGGITAGTYYYVRNRTIDSFQLSATPAGSIIDITSAGTGTHRLHLSRTLKSWHLIQGVTDATHLDIQSLSVANNQAYKGRSNGVPGNYEIRPAVRILMFEGNTLVCEPSTHVWDVGDSVECVVCPYPDVSGFQYSVAVNTPCGTNRSAILFRNAGGTAFDAGITLDGGGPMQAPGTLGCDQVAWNTGYRVGLCDAGLSVGSVRGTHPVTGQVGAAVLFEFAPAAPYDGHSLGWIGGSVFLRTFENVPLSGDGGFIWKMTTTGGASGVNGRLVTNTAVATDTHERMEWGGMFRTKPDVFANLPTASTALKGYIATVTDSSTITIGSTVAGGGSDTVLVWCSGTAWKVFAA